MSLLWRQFVILTLTVDFNGSRCLDVLGYILPAGKPSHSRYCSRDANVAAVLARATFTVVTFKNR